MSSCSLARGQVHPDLAVNAEGRVQRTIPVVADQQGHTLDVNLNVYTETTLERRIEAVQQLESAMVN